MTQRLEVKVYDATSKRVLHQFTIDPERVAFVLPENSKIAFEFRPAEKQ